MRPIKFRAWDKERKRMLSPAMPTLGGGLIWGPGPSYDCMGEGYEFMQFTGLLDKNGKEIYEGDIFGNLPQLRCVVERMEDGAWKLVFTDKRIQPWSIIDHRISASEVIGNIHENPELLGPVRGKGL